MRFDEIPGHSRVKEALISLADSHRLPHALMLTGPSGVGKMLLARTLIQYIHCTAPQQGEPCGRCASCRQHASFNHPDLHFIYPIVKSTAKKKFVAADEVDAWKRMLTDFPAMPPEKWLEVLEAGNSQPQIYVDDAEQIVAKEAYPPYSADYKFYLVWLPERLRPEAANKLLKVIEEPSPGTIFILVSNEEDKVLPTILSRTQRFRLSPLSRDEISQYLQRRYRLKDYEAFELSRLAEGRISKADELGGFAGETTEFEDIFKRTMRAAYSRKLGELKSLSEKTAGFGREKLIRFLDYMSRMTRENFIANLNMPDLAMMTRSEQEFSRKFSPFINYGNVEGIMTELERARTDVARNANAKIVMFDLFILLIGLLHRKPA